MVNGIHDSKYDADEIEALLDKVDSPDTTPRTNSQKLVTSGAVKAYVDSVMVHPRSDSTLTLASVFSKNDVVNFNGEMLMANKDTEDYPYTPVVYNGNVVMDGDHMVVADNTLSDDWDLI